MTAAWIAAAVRAKTLCRRRIGRSAARSVGSCRSLEDAMSALSSTPYGPDVRSARDLTEAQWGVDSTLIWHLRILAGWCPMLGSAPVRLLAGGYEIRNVVGHLLRLQGRSMSPPFTLGSLGEAWPAVARSRTGAEVRSALGRSVWGDPQSDDPAAVRLAMTFRWAARVYDELPDAADWASSAAGLVLARLTRAGADGLLPSGSMRQARRVAESGHAPKNLDRTDDWRGEVQWWIRVETDSRALLSRPATGPSAVIGATGLLASDAWLTKAALAIAARGGGVLEEVLGEVA
jgi:hypothetical protein